MGDRVANGLQEVGGKVCVLAIFGFMIVGFAMFITMPFIRHFDNLIGELIVTVSLGLTAFIGYGLLRLGEVLSVGK